MSWSVSAQAPRDEAIRQIREQFARITTLPVGEGARGEKIIDTIEQFAQKSAEPTDVLKISAWGWEANVWTVADPPRVTSVQGSYSVSVERPAPPTEQVQETPAAV